ncbi:MAG: hypothetical protein VYD19_07785 [Myxococcota bacterium]|nr:hypothetical protein [Myxococcota bacterium]
MTSRAMRAGQKPWKRIKRASGQRPRRLRLWSPLSLSTLCCVALAFACSDDAEGPTFAMTEVRPIERDISFPPMPGEPPPPRPDMAPLIDRAPPPPMPDRAPPVESDQGAESCETADEVRLVEPCGYERCVAGRWLRPTDTRERCNDHDDDCDGRADEELGLGDRCDEVVEGCAVRGVLRCDPEGVNAVCTGRPLMMGEEQCDGQDNDCDGQIDEGVSDGQLCCGSVNECPAEAQCMDGVCRGGDAPEPVVPESGTCAEPVLISGPGQYTVDGTDAGNEENSTTDCAAFGVLGADVVFRLRVDAPQRLRLDTAGNLFDTALYLRRGACDSLSVLFDSSAQLDCNDNESDGDWTAAIEFDAAANTDYYVIVDTTLNPVTIIEFLTEQEIIDLPFLLNVTAL